MREKHTSAALLFELLLASLVFMIAATALAGLFAGAHEKSRRAGRLQDSLSLAESACEAAYAREDPEETLLCLGFTGENGAYRYEGAGFTIEFAYTDTPAAGGVLRAGVLKAAAAAEGSRGETLFTLPCRRYFGGGDA